MKCDICGTESEFDAAFIKTPQVIQGQVQEHLPDLLGQAGKRAEFEIPDGDSNRWPVRIRVL